ncbi:MAG TPA: FlgD immunoglobulin-like domain containing protein, partial [bacterium]|nr:FlgD immunoglobulin-like domain containing protein [bacterium]
ESLYLGTVSSGTASFGDFSLDAGEVWDLYEFYVDPQIAGVPLHVSVANLTGNADLDVALWSSSTTTYDTGFGAEVFWNGAGPGEDEHLPAQMLSAGFHALAVLKHGAADASEAADFRLVISTANVVGAPEIGVAPDEFALQAPRPNPFRSAAAIRYDVPATGGHVRVSVFDLSGRRVTDLVDGVQPAGRHTASWNGRDRAGQRVVSGMYFVRLESPRGTETRKVTLLR